MANYNLREVLKQLGRNILSWVKSNCVNNCVSTTTNLPLAAAQGKVLQDQITTLNSNIVAKLDLSNFKVDYGSGVSDCNNMFRGIFTTNTAANRPSGSWCAILSMPINDKYNLQIAMALGSTNLYIRSSNNGTYSTWRKI